MSEKKSQQLGMSSGKASGILLKDILWDMLVKTNQTLCYHCGEEMSRSTFSVEHKEPWLDSEEPKQLFFSLENISFSHFLCNCLAARRAPQVKKHGISRYRAGCRCEVCVAAKSVQKRKYLDSKKT